MSASNSPLPWSRILAFAVDWAIISAYAVILYAILFLVAPGLGGDLFVKQPEPVSAHLIGFFSLTLPAVLYFALSEASRWQATLGKRVLNLQVVTRSGLRPPPLRTIIRALIKLLPWEAAHTVLWRIEGWPLDPAPITPLQVSILIGVWLAVAWYLILLFWGTGRTPYDWVAGTRVVAALR